MSDPTTYIVLVHWNQPQLLSRTVEAFGAQGLPTTIVVVDNGSSPENMAHVLALGEAVQNVVVIEMGENSGFGPAANAGLRLWLSDANAAPWAFVAPHDAVPDPGCLETMLESAGDEPLAGLMCADVGDGMVPVIDPYFGGMTIPGSTTRGWVSVDYPHGTLMGIDRRCAEEVGLFDEAFFAYCEEADLGWRATTRGYRCGLVRGAMVVNTHVGSSVAAVDYLQQRNTVHLVRRISGRYHALIRVLIGLGQLVIGSVRPSRAPLIFHAGARWAGLRDAVLGRWGPPPDRLFESKSG